MMTGLGKRELNKAKRRAAIVSLATRSFLEIGYAGTSMSAIADKLGGSKATLWAHFGSKEELFAAVVDNQVDSFSGDVEEVLISQTFSLPALRRACIRLLDCLLNPSTASLYRMVLGEGERFPEISEMFFSRGPRKIRVYFQQFFATRLEGAEAERFTRIVVNAINGYRDEILMRPDKPSPAAREEFLDNLIGSMDWPPFVGDDQDTL